VEEISTAVNRDFEKLLVSSGPNSVVTTPVSPVDDLADHSYNHARTNSR
jgi:hypothetical protein